MRKGQECDSVHMTALYRCVILNGIERYESKENLVQFVGASNGTELRCA